MLFKFKENARTYNYDSCRNLICELEKSRSAKIPSKGIRVFIELTKKCNFACSYCYLNLNSKNKKISEPSIKNKIDKITSAFVDNFQNKDNIEIIFYGGEPLLEFKLLQELVNFFDEKVILNKKNIQYGITTNGLLITPAIVDYLIKTKTNVTISLDGSSKTTELNRGKGIHELIESTIYRFAKEGHRAKIMATLSPNTVSSFPIDLDYLLGLPVKEIQFFACDSICKSSSINEKHVSFISGTLRKKVFDLINDKDYDSLKKIGNLISPMHSLATGSLCASLCDYGKNVFGISFDGKLYPCPCFMGYKDFVIENGQFKIPNKSGNINCTKCIGKNFCGGGCLFTHYIASKAAPEFISAKCMLNKNISRLAIEAYLKLYT